MQAVILLGGKGTRLASLYPDRPKALVPVAGRPFIEWQVDWLQRGGVTDIHLAAGHMAEQIQEWAAQQDQITVSQEPHPLGTGGALTCISSYLQDDHFLLVNGDTLLPNLDLNRMTRLATDDAKDWNLIIAVTRIESAGRFGTVEFDSTGLIHAFREKADRQAGWINGGVYWIPRLCLNNLKPNAFCSLETDLFPQWVSEQRLQACPSEPPLLDMGTPEGLEEMNVWLKR